MKLISKIVLIILAIESIIFLMNPSYLSLVVFIILVVYPLTTWYMEKDANQCE